MTQELIQEFMKRLDAIGGAAVNGGKYVFEQMVRFERIDSIVDLAVFFSLGMLVVIGCLLAARYNHKRSTSEELPENSLFGWDRAEARLARNWCYAGCAAGALIILLAVDTNIPSILAPEAVVLRNLVNQCMSK